MSAIPNTPEELLVRMVPFISALYKDLESDLLDRQIFAYNANRPDRLYFSWDAFERGAYRGGRLGKAETESVARQLLLFSSRVSRVVGVPEHEFFRFLESGQFTVIGGGDQRYLERLIKKGDIRRVSIGGVCLLFPTGQLLRVYRCGVSKDPALFQIDMRARLRGTIRTHKGDKVARDLNCRVLVKIPGGLSMQDMISQNSYAVLESIPQNSEEFKFTFLFLGTRIIEVVDTERAEWLGELFRKEEMQFPDLPRNAFELYLADSTWSSGRTTFRQDGNFVFIDLI